MTIWNDRRILERCRSQRLIVPYAHRQERYVNDTPIISWGLSSFGYDVRLADRYKVYSCFTTPPDRYHDMVDPKQPHAPLTVQEGLGHCIIPPNSFILGYSLEHISMPNDVMALCLGKSTYARCGIITNVTPLEPGWRGHITIEISNTTPLPAKVYSFEGILQLVFFQGTTPLITYADRKGKYQDQPPEPTLPRV